VVPISRPLAILSPHPGRMWLTLGRFLGPNYRRTDLQNDGKRKRGLENDKRKGTASFIFKQTGGPGEGSQRDCSKVPPLGRFGGQGGDTSRFWLPERKAKTLSTVSKDGQSWRRERELRGGCCRVLDGEGEEERSSKGVTFGRKHERGSRLLNIVSSRRFCIKKCGQGGAHASIAPIATQATHTALSKRGSGGYLWEEGSQSQLGDPWERENSTQKGG